MNAGQTRSGSLYLSDHHIIFVFPVPELAKEESGSSAESNPKAPVAPKTRESWISYPIIAQCTYRPTPPSSGIPSSIRLRGRDFTFVTFTFADDRAARETFEFIRSRTCRLDSIEKLFAFSHVPSPREREFNGWDLYDARAEFRRQGIGDKLVDRGWRISNINKDYKFSPTYPSVLVVPSKISDNVIKYAGSFRTRARIPTLTYLHPVNNCSITRSSQPVSGWRGKRSIQDEKLVAACFSGSASTAFPEITAPAPEPSPEPARDRDPPSPTGSELEVATREELDFSDTERLEDELIDTTNEAYDGKTGKRLLYGAQQSNLIVDARPTINAVANQLAGGGSEIMDHYKFATKAYLNIDNIHVMRDSLAMVIEAIKDADVSPLPPNRELLAKSGWIKHITGILDGAALIARRVGIHHSHVLIHCSDGWDRTSQLSALAQLMLEPYYRTIDGFIVLVEKDWVSFGHMFQHRTGFLSHEKWFTVQTDALAGSTIQPGEDDGRLGGGSGGGGGVGGGDALENAIATARRFFKNRAGVASDNVDSDADASTGGDETPNSNRKHGPLDPKEATHPKETSPVFHQFLDATYQLLRQHPTRFEFNERFLRRLLYHTYSCQYGTFLYNSELARREARVRERTRSVWDYFLARRAEFTNPDYDGGRIDDSVRGRERIIFPRLSDVRWWHQVFGRTDEEMNGPLNAAALSSAAVADRLAAYQASSHAPSPRTGSPVPGSVAFAGGSEGTSTGPPPSSPLQLSTASSATEASQPKQQQPRSVLTSIETSRGSVVVSPTAVQHHGHQSAPILIPTRENAASTAAVALGSSPAPSGPASLQKSVSADGAAAFAAAIRGSIVKAGLGIGGGARSMFAGLTQQAGVGGAGTGSGAGGAGSAANSIAGSGTSSPALTAHAHTQRRTVGEQEMTEMD